MTKFLRTFWPVYMLSMLALFFVTDGAVAQPVLGTASTYGAFSGAGAIQSTGLTLVTGDIGTNAGAFTGFPPGQYTGAKHVQDPQSLVVKNDVTSAYNQGLLIPCDTTISVTMGNGQVLTPRTYCLGPASTLTGNLTFDAKGNSSAIFIVKVGGALNVAAHVNVILLNQASAANIYWVVNGAVSILDSTVFYGTIIANGAIHLYTGSSLTGRMLAVTGAVTFAGNHVTVPSGTTPGTLVVVKPAAGDTIVSGTNYQIVWTGTGLKAHKTLEYSLDGGTTWKTIGTMDSSAMTYSWNVPDTVSTNAVVRVTDSSGVTGKSGSFVIKRGTKGTITVVDPSTGETIVGGTQNYQIVWTGSQIASQKKFEYSLDSGKTWKLIDSISADVFTHSWNVPDTASTLAVIRITDKNGATGKSGIFTILSSKASVIVITRPAAGDSIASGTQAYQITWTGAHIANKKTIEYSLDGGVTWILIGVMHSDLYSFGWNVPDTASNIAMIRITDSVGTVGKSGVFRITRVVPAGAFTSLTLSNLTQNNIKNSKSLGIAWTYTGDIGPSVHVEYSLDGGVTWGTVGVVLVSEVQSTTWMTPATGYYPNAYIRVTSTTKPLITRMSQPFSIGDPNAVAIDARSLGYSLSNFPNPVSGQTTISYALPVRGDVTLIVSDAVGRELMSVGGKNMSAGSHTVNFNGTNLPSGVYTYRMFVGGMMLTGKMDIVK